MKRFIISVVWIFFVANVFSQNPVTVVSPNGGENWITGCPSLIQWITSNTAGPVKIELYKNNTFNLTICSQVPAGMNSFTWVPPFNMAPGNNFKVKITLITSVASFDFSDGNFSINPGSITVGSPNGGETWVKGTMHPILWTDNICENVRLELWKGGVFNSVIAASVPSNGTFNWTVPNTTTLLPGNDYKVKVMSLANAAGTTGYVFDFSNNNFIISQGQNTGTIAVVAPNGGENWIIGCPALIQWISTTPSGPVKIELIKNNVFYMTICSQVPAGQSTFTWIPPYSVVPGDYYKVKITSLTSAAAFDLSDGNFSIHPGSITVGSPNGGETWVKGTMHPILWTDNLCDNVRIELWKNGVFNSVIAASVPSNGAFNWTVPNTTTLVPGNDYKVKIMSLANAAGTTVNIFDFSNTNFTILQGQNTGAIMVVTPNGGENWIIGCPALIQWISTTPSGPVKIELIKNNVFCMTICAQVPAGQSTFTWIPPYSVIPGDNYKVKVTSLTSAAAFDLSDGNFSINPGSITVGSPNGGETWVKGTMHPILWTDNLCDNVRIELWKNGVFNSVIAASVPSNGAFNWTIPNTTTLVPGNDYRVKIMSLANAAGTTINVSDLSDNNFSILAGSPSSVTDQCSSIKVFPNPFCDQLHIQFQESSDTPVSIEIFKDNGNLVASKSIGLISTPETIDLNTSGLPHGKYLIVVKRGSKIVSTHQVFLVR